MREKSRSFRSLLLESLESRTVFAADAFYDMWQGEHRESRVEITLLQDGRAQFGAIVIGPSHSIRTSEFTGAQATRNAWKVRLNDHYDDHALNDLSPEGEALPLPPQFNNQLGFKPSANRGDDIPTLGRPVNQLPVNQSPTGSRNGGLGSPGFDSPLTNVTPPSSPQFNFNIEHSLGSSGSGNSSTNTVIIVSTNNRDSSNPSNSQSNSQSTRSAAPSVTSPVTSPSASVVDASTTWLNAHSMTPSQTTFDFSANELSSQSVATSSRNSSDPTFRFSRPSVASVDRLFDPQLAEQAEGIASLETLLSDLAENHRQSRAQSHDSNRPNSRFETQRKLAGEAAMGAIARTEGVFIALALNRDISHSNLADLADEVNRENKTWLANVGVYREFENAAIVATEFVAAPNPTPRGTLSNSKSDLTQAEAEVGDSQFHPLLASSTAVLGAMLFSLRRVRKNVRLMYTKR